MILKRLLDVCKVKLILLLLVIGSTVSPVLHAQESVFGLFKPDLRMADDYYLQGSYGSALELYELIATRKTAPFNIELRLARCYYFLKDYKQALEHYEKFKQAGNKIAPSDWYYLAECYAAEKQYEKAQLTYQICLEEEPQNELLLEKIWRIDQLNYLLEDSSNFEVRYIQANTENSDLSAIPYKKGVVFTANRPTVSMVQKTDALTKAPFYHLFYSSATEDPFSIGALNYGKASEFAKNLHKQFHVSNPSFYDGGKKMVLTATEKNSNSEEPLTLQLYFAAYIDGAWQITEAFPHNSPDYSLSEPSISEDGSILYFASDKPGGFGAKDIYYSINLDSTWSKPVNLGDIVNTAKDESYPFLQASKKRLYFSSNGHAGIGGLDIFRVDVSGESFTDLQNMGYPLNSSYDDFAFSVDSLSQQGYLTSNRLNGGLDDDIYEFDMNLQSYPLQVEGVVKFIEHNWMDSTELEILPNVQLTLIDIVNNKTIEQTSSDDQGRFQFNIPYYSKYKLGIVGRGLDGVVSFEVPKHKKTKDTYEIVVVNDDFKNASKQKPE